MNSPRLTVILPNYNHARYLPAAIDAIMSQSVRPAEVIVIDDGSTDNSREVIAAYARKYPEIRDLPNERNLGVVATLNRGVELATCDYVHFAAADDVVQPGLYEKSLTMLRQHPGAALCSSIAQYVDEHDVPLRLDPAPGMVSRSARYFAPSEILAALHKHGPWYTGNTGIWRREVVIELGKFRPELHSFVDGFLFQVAALKYGACFVPEILGNFRVLANSVSSELSHTVDLFRKRMQLAERLMRTTFADVFPTSYVDKFARDNAVRASCRQCEQLERWLRDQMPFGTTRWTDGPGLLQRFVLRALIQFAAYHHSVWSLWTVVQQRLMMRIVLNRRKGRQQGEVDIESILAGFEHLGRFEVEYRRTLHEMRKEAGRFDRGMLSIASGLLSLRVAMIRSRLSLTLARRLLTRTVAKFFGARDAARSQASPAESELAPPASRKAAA